MHGRSVLLIAKLCALALLLSIALIWVRPLGPVRAAFTNEGAPQRAPLAVEDPAPLGDYRLAFQIQDFGNGIDVYVLDAGGLHRLTDGPIVEEDRSGLSPPGGLVSRRSYNARPAFSRDGSKIAFISNRDGEGEWEIYVMNADGSGQTRITHSGGYHGSLAWSPDGTKIAFERNWEIYVMNADGSDLTNLTKHPAYDAWPTWSPDGTKIAFMSDRECLCGAAFIHVMNADGSEVEQLTSVELPIDTPWYDGTPAWSPDGTKIAFVRAHNDLGWLNGEIYVMNADGSGQTRLTVNAIDEGEPAWSPDGSKIAFVASRPPPDSPIYDIHVMNADGSERTSVTDDPSTDEQLPSWGPPAPDSAPAPDGDGDGCSDEREQGPNPALGGARNPESLWDFIDQWAAGARDKRVNIVDVAALVSRFGTTGDPYSDPLVVPMGQSGYHSNADRTPPPMGANLWNAGPADGQINIVDLSLLVAQFGHSCA